MGLRRWLVGHRPPNAGAVPVSADALRLALLALDRDTAPYRVRRATEAEGSDIVPEWKLADPRWSAVFERAGIEASLTFLLWVSAEPVPTASVVQTRDIGLERSHGVLDALDHDGL